VRLGILQLSGTQVGCNHTAEVSCQSERRLTVPRAVSQAVSRRLTKDASHSNSSGGYGAAPRRTPQHSREIRHLAHLVLRWCLTSVVLASHRTSLPFWWLPEFNFVALWIHDPSEFPVLRVVGLIEHVATFLAQSFEKRCQIFDSIIHHEGRLARSEVLAVCWTDQPGRSSLDRVAFGVSPFEGSSTQS